MSESKDAPAPQIIIVRRKGGGDEGGHHGGAWKIAYADFMTAMMAFFLVMWLINASNKETKASVASYFNPLKLTDDSPLRKGLADVVEGKPSQGKPTPPVDGIGKAEDVEGTKQKSTGKGNEKSDSKQSAVVEDPYDVLKRLGADVGKAGSESDSKEDKTESTTAADSGDAFIDPFNPLNPTPSSEKADPLMAAGQKESAQVDIAKLVDGVLNPNDGKAAAMGRGGDKDGAGGLGPDGKSVEVRKETEEERKAREAAENEQKLAALKVEARKIAEEIRAAVGDRAPGEGPAIAVGIVEGEIVIQLTDTSNFGMFGIGSADPDDRLVKLLQSLAGVISARPETLIIKGHTDARPYRRQEFDNWRLSLERAEAAYMLLRKFGVELSRVERIEAHAARNLKLPNEPEAAANRRIELVLRRQGA